MAKRMKNHWFPGEPILTDARGNKFVVRVHPTNRVIHGAPKEVYLGCLFDTHYIAIDPAVAKQLKPWIDQLAEQAT